MKNFLTMLSELQKMILLSVAIGLLLLTGSIVGLFFNQPGWMVGIAIGTIVEIINIVLLYKGSEFVINFNKPGLFIVSFLGRMLIVTIAFVLCVVLDFKLHVDVFKNSIWGVLIGLGPTEIVTMICLGKTKKKSEVVETK